MLSSLEESLYGVPMLIDSKLTDNESSLWCVILRCRPLYRFLVAPIPGPALLDPWSSSCVACEKSFSPVNELNGY